MKRKENSANAFSCRVDYEQTKDWDQWLCSFNRSPYLSDFRAAQRGICDSSWPTRYPMPCYGTGSLVNGVTVPDSAGQVAYMLSARIARAIQADAYRSNNGLLLTLIPAVAK